MEESDIFRRESKHNQTPTYCQGSTPPQPQDLRPGYIGDWQQGVLQGWPRS